MNDDHRLPPPPSYDQIFGPAVNNGPARSFSQPSFNPSFSQTPLTSQPSLPPMPSFFELPVIPMPPPEVSVDEDSAMWFNAVDENGDGRITLRELREALINFDGKPFDVKTCHFLVHMFDDNGDGTINLNEFCALKAYIDKWKRQFDQVDTDRSGNIDLNEFIQAIHLLGYQLSPQFAARVLRMFGNCRNRTGMNFDAFIRSCAFIHSMASVFSSKQEQQQGGVNAASSTQTGTISLGFEEASFTLERT